MISTEHLAKLDQLILFELDHQSRIPLTELASSLGISRERVASRIDNLLEQGVVRAFTTSVNPYKFGLAVYKTYVQLENNSHRVSLFIRYLQRHPRVYWYAESEGSWDLMFAIFGKSPLEFYKIQGEILSRFSDVVLEFSVYSIVNAYFFRKRYLKGLGTEFFVLGGEPEAFGLSDLEFGILEQLSINSRASTVQLAKKLDSSAHLVRDRITKLEEQNIITGYRVELNLQKIGMNLYKAQLHLRRYDLRIERDLLEFCKTNTYVVLFIQQVGDCKLELEFEVPGFDVFMAQINEVRGRFSKYIRRIDFVRIRREEYKWMPFDMVREKAVVKG